MANAKENAEVVEITNGEWVHKLIRPVVVNGDKITELKFDFEGLDGNTLLAVNREIAATMPSKQGGSFQEMVLPETDKTYQAFVAAKAAGVMVEVILALKAPDFNIVTRTTLAFLLGTGSAG